jgi:hypothetical protein
LLRDPRRRHERAPVSGMQSAQARYITKLGIVTLCLIDIYCNCNLHAF